MQKRPLSRASLMAALGLTALVPVAGATIALGSDRPPLVVESGAAPSGSFDRIEQIDQVLSNRQATPRSDTERPETVRPAAAGDPIVEISDADSVDPDVAERAAQAFLDFGYTYDDAANLAGVWGLETPYDAKVAKGKYLLGLTEHPPGWEELPSDAEIRADFESMASDEAAVERALTAYFDAGYDYEHALWLVDCWGIANTDEAKVLKGLFVLGEIDFPGCGTFGPSAQADAGDYHGDEGGSIDDTELTQSEEFDELIDRSLDAYFDAGYDYDHAVYLADYWGLETPYDAKITKGKVLLGLFEFPEEGFAAPTVGQTESGDERVDPAEDYSIDDSLDAYFDAGYDYDHAVYLADYWGLETPYDAKILKGDVILGWTSFPDAGFASPTADSESDAAIPTADSESDV